MLIRQCIFFVLTTDAERKRRFCVQNHALLIRYGRISFYTCICPSGAVVHLG